MPNNTITFLLNTELKQVDFAKENLSPTTTLLQYLRSLPEYTGVKEGCGEGDCGACTIVLGTLTSANKIEYRAYDSCLIFLPYLHGKQLITVEHIGERTNLHPVQEAMVKKHASQCGYCTPGFVMSLFSMYKSGKKYDRNEIVSSLSGNLCRCTGYQSILHSAREVLSAVKDDKFSLTEKETAQKLRQIAKQKESVLIASCKQKYYIPVKLKEALRIKKQCPTVVIVQGATDFALKVSKHLESPAELLDLSMVKKLSGIKKKREMLIFGAGTPIEDVKNAVEHTHPALHAMLRLFGSLQIRNKASIGGNIATASPIGDSLPVLMALNAEIELRSLDAKRKLNIKDFILGYRKTAINPDEMITRMALPAIPENVIIKSYKVSKRKELDISSVSACFRMLKSENGKVKDIEIFYGGMAAYTKKAEKTCAFLMKKKWCRSNVEAAMKYIDEDFTPISDARAEAEARKIMARNLLLKFWNETKTEK